MTQRGPVNRHWPLFICGLFASLSVSACNTQTGITAQPDKNESSRASRGTNGAEKLIQELDQLELPEGPEIEDWIELSAKADGLTRRFFDKLFVIDARGRLRRHEKFSAEIQTFAMHFGKGSPSQDFVWLMSAPYALTLSHGHFSCTVDGSYGGDVFDIRTETAKAHVTLFLEDKVARERFAQSVAWIGQSFTPRSQRATLSEHPILLEMARLNSNGPGESDDPRKKPWSRDQETGKPTRLYWWEARLAITFRTICDSDSDLRGWEPGRIDECYRKWFKEWSAARKAGLVRPGRKFGWRVDNSNGAKSISALAPPTIPSEPIDGLSYPRLEDNYLKEVLFGY